MSPERWQQIEQLYHAALERAPAERAAFLQQACADDDALRREVESLLASHEQAASFIEAPPDNIAAEMLAEDQARSMLGRTLGHYELRALLGAGGMGEVYRARDTRLDRDVAVKILPAHLAEDAEALRRFEREAKAVAALSHPNILAIFDFGTENKLSYAVMELLEGETLRARLSHSALTWQQAVEISADIAEGLAAAHAKGIIHRDLKPENIFLTTEGQVKILDFGIARVKRAVLPDAETLTATSDTTRPGLVMGTLGYMSPEQVRGEEADTPSDVFSFGCVLYEMVSGQRPFARATGAETIAAILKEEPPPLTGLVKELPASLARLIRQCLEKRPEQRYQAARALTLELRALLSGSGQWTLPEVRRPARPAIWLGAALMMLLLSVAVWFYWGKAQPAIDSLAVLPLLNVTGDAEVEYLSDGIAESLINNLSQLPQLRVMARGTTFTYKGKQVDPRQVGRDLGVRAVLTGRVTQRGNRLIVQMDLADAREGSQLWAERYDRPLGELAVMEAEVVRRISERVRPRLAGAEKERLNKRYSEQGEAHRLYLKGRHYWENWTGSDASKGIEYFERALQVDPGYALAWVGLADAYSVLSGTYRSEQEMMPKVREAAKRALEIDETLGEAHVSLASVMFRYDWNWAGAEQELKRAIELSPSCAMAHFEYGLLLITLGRVDEARLELKRAQELDPLSPSFAVTAVWPHYQTVPAARRYDLATTELKKVIETNPGFAPAHTDLAAVYALDGKFAEAIAEAQRARQLNGAPWTLAWLTWIYAVAGQREQAQKAFAEVQEIARNEHVSPIFIARIYAALGQREQAFAWLEKAYEKRDERLALLNVSMAFDGLRADPRFTDLRRRMNLAP